MSKPVLTYDRTIERKPHTFEIVRWNCPLCKRENISSSTPWDEEITERCESCNRRVKIIL